MFNLNPRLREQIITLACQTLRRVFDLPRLLRGHAIPQLKDVPPGARVALIKPCCLGDVLMATATVAALSQARPDLQLEFVVSEWSRQVLKGNPHLARLVPTGVAGSNFSWSEYLRLAGRLRREKYAAALVLDRSPRLNLLPWLAGIPVRAGVDSLGRGFASNVRATQRPIVQHEAEVYLDVLRALGLSNAKASLEYFPSSEALASFKRKALQLNIDLQKPLAVIHPGGGQNPDTQVLSKRWPAERFALIATRLVGQGWQVVIIGASGDKIAAAQVEQIARQQLNSLQQGIIINACECFSFAESGVLLAQVGLFVGNDTGLMHLAVASGTAVVAVFGPSSPVAYGPYTEKGRAVAPVAPGVQAGLPLKEYGALSVAEGGIEAVTVEMVWEAVQELAVKAGQ